MNSTAIKPYPIITVAPQAYNNHTLITALLNSANEYSAQLHGRRVWLACSGGRDSLALAASCSQLYRQGQLAFLPQLLHVNHNLQADSQLWANHVATWAQAQQLSCTILQVQVIGTDEQAARSARYQAMLSYINQGDVLLLGHHGDDQAETMLMRLIQGAGVKGLSAMQPWRQHWQGARYNILWRPWLSVRRTTISYYAEQLQLPYIDDPTNEDGDNVRSRLRRDIMPQLAIYNPNVIENMARSAQLFNDAQATVEAQAMQDWQQTDIKALSVAAAQQALDGDKLAVLPDYRQRQLLHFWLAQDEPLPPTKQLVDDVLRLVQRQDNDHQTQLDWYAQHQRYHIRRYRKQLYRLSQSWLEWLVIAPVTQTQQFLSHQSQRAVLNLRENTFDTNARYHWQLCFLPTELTSLLIHNSNELIVKATPLTRQKKLKTSLAGQAQSGKKLYQTLGIPVWLRDSLLIISVIMTDSGTTSDLPLLLISPFESWVLETGSQYVQQKADFRKVIKNSLYSNH